MRRAFLQNKIGLTVLLVFTLVFLLTPSSSQAINLSDQAEISIITCSPGNEVYSVYGHSAIRVYDEAYNYDAVFNYGIFDFSSPNFLYRFAKGQTDYKLGVYSFDDFVVAYKKARRSIFEQVLNLSQTEKQKIFDFLIWNAKPENRVYRYNFFFDNCATRIRDVVEDNVEGGVNYVEGTGSHKTLRQLTKDYHGRLLWYDFGTDILVSADADREATLREDMFLPDYVMMHFATATRGTGNSKVVKKAHYIYESHEEVYRSSKLIGPFVVFLLLLVLISWVSFKQYQKGQMKNALNNVVYGISGFMGLVLVWFVLFSEHPAMSPNYNLCWAVPLNLIFVFAWTVKKWRPVLKYYHLFISIWMILFVCFGSFLPQVFHPAFYLLALIVLSRSLPNSLLIFKKQKAAAVKN